MLELRKKAEDVLHKALRGRVNVCIFGGRRKLTSINLKPLK